MKSADAPVGVSAEPLMSSVWRLCTITRELQYELQEFGMVAAGGSRGYPALLDLSFRISATANAPLSLFETGMPHSEERAMGAR